MNEPKPLPPRPQYDKCNAGHQLVPYYNEYRHAWTWDCPTERCKDA